jgi:DHA2 family multidrug resistance protein
MAFGFGLQTLAGVWMLTFDLNVTMDILMLNSAFQGFAVGSVWVPMTIVAFDTLAAKDRAEASSVFHLLRYIGSSFFISLSIAEIVRTTGANYSRMSEMITPFNPVLTMPNMTGMWNFDTVSGLAKLAAEINRQVGDDRLSQRLHDVHGYVGFRGRARIDGAPAPLLMSRDRGMMRHDHEEHRNGYPGTT